MRYVRLLVIAPLALVALGLVALLAGGRPGPHGTASATPASDFADLAAHWAPRVYQDTDAQDPDADYITSFDFDGNWDGEDNWEHQDDHPGEWLRAYAYYWMVETSTHWFIGYAFYHPRDWGGTFPEITCLSDESEPKRVLDLSFGSCHENDMEGVVLTIRRDGSAYGQFLLMNSVYHAEILSYRDNDNSPSSDVIGDFDGDVKFTGSHPHIFVDAQSHAIRGDTDWDETDFPANDGIIYTYAGAAEVPPAGDDQVVSYELLDIQDLWDRRGYFGEQDPFASFGTFRGDDWKDDAANAPWGWDVYWCNPLINPLCHVTNAAPAFFCDPASVVADRFGGLGDVSRIYTDSSFTPGPPDPCPTCPQSGTIVRVSVTSACEQGNWASVPAATAISGDGNYVAFASWAANLRPNPGEFDGANHVFVHHRQTGTTEIVSACGDGSLPLGHGSAPSISGDGRYVAFELSAAPSFASDLFGVDIDGDGICDTDFDRDGICDLGDILCDTNSASDIFVRDRVSGAIVRISNDVTGDEGNGGSRLPAVSADGRYVAFESDATNLVEGDTNDVRDIFVHDRDTDEDGIFDESEAVATIRVSVDSAGNQGNLPTYGPDVSCDGRYIAFWSEADNLVPNDTNSVEDVFVHDRLTGTTERVSVDSAGNEGTAISSAPAISADGRFVAFESDATNLVPGDPTFIHREVFVHDRQSGTTERASVDSAGNQGDFTSSGASISGDGRYVGFESLAGNLVTGDLNNKADGFVHDRLSGTTERVSVDSFGNEADNNSGSPSISADGRHVAFESDASNLVPGDTNGWRDIFARDLGDADGDGEWDPFDPCPANPDCDGDGWTDWQEAAYIGTDPVNACTPGGWPPDPRPLPGGDGEVLIDDVAFAAAAFGNTTTPRAEIASQDGVVQIDDVAAFASRFGHAC